MPSLLDRAVNRLAGATDEPQRVQWRRHGRSYDFEVPGDNLFSVEDGALWPAEGTVRLDLAGPSSSAAVVRDEAATVEIRAITLDELVSAHGQLDLLELDVEGAEFQLVQQAPAPAHRAAGGT